MEPTAGVMICMCVAVGLVGSSGSPPPGPYHACYHLQADCLESGISSGHLCSTMSMGTFAFYSYPGEMLGGEFQGRGMYECYICTLTEGRQANLLLHDTSRLTAAQSSKCADYQLSIRCHFH